MREIEEGEALLVLQMDRGCKNSCNWSWLKLDYNQGPCTRSYCDFFKKIKKKRVVKCILCIKEITVAEGCMPCLHSVRHPYTVYVCTVCVYNTWFNKSLCFGIKNEIEYSKLVSVYFDFQNFILLYVPRGLGWGWQGFVAM